MTSQFSIYTSGDVGAPILTGTSGSMVSLLDAVLVNGYGNKPSLGWTKPLPNENTGTIGCWKQPSGSQLILFVNDSAVTASITVGAGGGTRDAFVCGWETMVGLTGSVMGVGGGQFPLPSQVYPTVWANSTGSLIWRKSTTQDTTPRNWILMGDEYTFYLFVQTGDLTSAIYSMYGFGDVFSLKLTPDYYKAFIFGRNFIGTGPNSETQVNFGDLSNNLGNINAQHYFYLARGFGGTPGSVTALKVGDVGKAPMTTNFVIYNTPAMTTGATVDDIGAAFGGIIPVANPADNSLYLSPIWVVETSNTSLRGRFRGMYHLCHSSSSFADGQVFSGANEYAGKTFQIIKRGPYGGMWVMEISDTVETNDLP